jgi:hypothetical protein
MTTYLGQIWYHIWDDDSVYYPCWNPSPLFEIIDGRLSKYWLAGSRRAQADFVFMASYVEWVNDSGYVGRLIDNEPGAVSLFMRYKDLMDLEFQTSSPTMV